ncbi:helix-turn-helix transcriptional regulator, partial [Arthrobacter deserti]|nr:helix-turn-helix transcriptional regulator [Arthrobacter deserti]
RAAQKYIYAHSGSFDFAIGQCGGGQALTAREREMAELVAANQPNSAIARHFGISVRTVEGHLHKLYSKLQLRHSPVLEAAAHEEEVPWLTRT